MTGAFLAGGAEFGKRIVFGHILWLVPRRVVSVTAVPLALKHRRILGENVRTQRKLRAFSQEKLAEKADLHSTYISDIECGKETISVDSLARIAAALKATVHDLTRGF